MCPLYISGLIGPDDRKSVQPMAERLASGDYDQLHYFVAAGVWDAAPLETELLIQADRLVGGGDAVLVIDDTALRFVTFGICSPRTGAQGRQLKILCEAQVQPLLISSSAIIAEPFRSSEPEPRL